MTINGMQLPPLFVECVKTGRLRRSVGSWQLKNDVDDYHNPLESELGQIFPDEVRILKETRALSNYFEKDGCYGEPVELNMSRDQPGFIPDIVDFDEIVCFGISADGSPFCFDYRENKEEPRVIWWDDIYWRRVAPDFAAFLELFDIK